MNFESKKKKFDASLALNDLSLRVVQELKGGKNNRVLLVEAATGKRYILKKYYQYIPDLRDRMRTEYRALSFLSTHQFSCVPKPIAFDFENNIALYEYIKGKTISGKEIKTTHVKQFLEFIYHLSQVSQTVQAKKFTDASDACFSLDEVKISIIQRLNKLTKKSNSFFVTPKLICYLESQFKPGFKKICRFTKQTHSTKHHEFTQRILSSLRILSPSDFGFHNALITQKNRVVLIDFEYFGWDDPAKLINDFLLHPGQTVPVQYKKEFISSLKNFFKQDVNLSARIKISYPYHALKWCLIMLNVFLRDGLERRKFSGYIGHETKSLQDDKLHCAEQLLSRTLEQLDQFPYE